MQAVFMLADVTLAPVESLRSQFNLVRSSADVTATAVGSTGLIVGSTLYLVAPATGRKHQQLVELTRQLNRLLGGCIQDLQPVPVIVWHPILSLFFEPYLESVGGCEMLFLVFGDFATFRAFRTCVG
jgi:ABC-type nitrate/sulfonate/bicarbonate transport system permease component